MKKKVFTVTSQKKFKKVVSMWLSSWKLSFQSTCFIKIRQFFSNFYIHFEFLLGWECTYICHDLRTEKEEIYVKKGEYKESNWHPNDTCKFSFKHTFVANSDHFLSYWFVHFEPVLEWEVGYICLGLRIGKEHI